MAFSYGYSFGYTPPLERLQKIEEARQQRKRPAKKPKSGALKEITTTTGDDYYSLEDEGWYKVAQKSREEIIEMWRRGSFPEYTRHVWESEQPTEEKPSEKPFKQPKSELDKWVDNWLEEEHNKAIN